MILSPNYCFSNFFRIQTTLFFNGFWTTKCGPHPKAVANASKTICFAILTQDALLDAPRWAQDWIFGGFWKGLERFLASFGRLWGLENWVWMVSGRDFLRSVCASRTPCVSCHVTFATGTPRCLATPRGASQSVVIRLTDVQVCEIIKAKIHFGSRLSFA